MTTSIVDANVFTDPIVVPTDGDVRDAASVESFAQTLSNRTRRLLNIAQGTEDVEVAQTFTRVVGGEWLDAPHNPSAVVQWEVGGNGEWAAVAAIVGELRGSLNDLLPDGCTLTRLRVMVTPVSARSGANRMGLELRRLTYTLPVAPAVTPASDVDASVFTAFDDTSTDQQMIDSGIISETVTKSNIDLILQVRSGLGGSAGDLVHMIEVTFTDPGRRW